jgi:hypothetical protein
VAITTLVRVVTFPNLCESLTKPGQSDNPSFIRAHLPSAVTTGGAKK